MPPVNIHLLALSPQTTIPSYLSALRSSTSTQQPLLISRAIRWIIRPEKFDVSHLVNTPWDLLIITPLSSPLNPYLLSPKWITTHYTLTAGVPSSLIRDFGTKNDKLLHPDRANVPELTNAKPLRASSAQGLEVSPELESWANGFTLGKGAVSMLNLLAFKPGKAAHDSYLQYGKGFANSAGAKRGGTAKIVGRVIQPGDGEGKGERKTRWEEIALAHYPSIQHFVEMLGSEDYQEINHRFRLPALEDTCILCTSELDPILSEDGKAKL